MAGVTKLARRIRRLLGWGDEAAAVAKAGTKAAREAAEVAEDATKAAKKAANAAGDAKHAAPKTPCPTEAAPSQRPGTRGHPDHQADVKGPGFDQARDQLRPGERVVTEGPVVGHPGINRRADNQVIGPDGRTRVVIESERRPNGPYHQKRVQELEGSGIEVQTRPLPKKPPS